MVMRKTIILLILLTIPILSQSYYNWENYTVDKFYEKVDLDYGTLDQNGDQIDYIYIEKEVDAGIYEIEITDADGDLYEIKGTNLFIKFLTYYGYAGYGEEGILEVNQNGYATFYKKEY